MVKPSWSPTTAATKHPIRTAARFSFPWLARMPGGEEERVAGEEEADQEARLGEDDQDQPDLAVRAQVDSRISFGSRLSARIVESRCTTRRIDGPGPPVPERPELTRRPRPWSTLTSMLPAGPESDPTGPLRRPHWSADRTPQHEDRRRDSVAKPLVIVESRAKAKTIEGFLGRDGYTVHGQRRAHPRPARRAPRRRRRTSPSPRSAGSASTSTTTSRPSTSCPTTRSTSWPSSRPRSRTRASSTSRPTRTARARRSRGTSSRC